LSTRKAAGVKPRPQRRELRSRQPLLAWVARTLKKPIAQVTVKFCADKNSCGHKTLKRMHTRPEYYVICLNQGNCTMQRPESVTVDLSYIDVPDEEGDE
jgi:hypothetical protein